MGAAIVVGDYLISEKLVSVEVSIIPVSIFISSPNFRKTS